MTRAARKVVVVAALGGAAWWLASCRDIPAPEGGVVAISNITLPSPGLVVNDTMRDSNGVAVPLQVTAFGVDGEPITPPTTPMFIVLDTGAHLVGPLLIGDDAGTTVRVVGSVGSLQTQLVSVKVTESPDTLVAADSTLHHKTYQLESAADSVANSADLSVLVQHRGATTSGVEAVIVHYAIDKKPAGSGEGETAVLVNGSRLSARDTTDATGKASRTARLRLGALTAFGADTVVVSATSSYRGSTIGTVQFTIIYTQQP
ncbi:MAG: hypothetical protein WD825_03030 [Gemmatimonadaceae bacterium]